MIPASNPSSPALRARSEIGGYYPHARMCRRYSSAHLRGAPEPYGEGRQKYDRVPELALPSDFGQHPPWPSPSCTSASAGSSAPSSHGEDRVGKGNRDHGAPPPGAHRAPDRYACPLPARRPSDSRRPQSMASRTRWPTSPVTPDTLVRWHRKLARRRWRRTSTERPEPAPGDTPMNSMS